MSESNWWFAQFCHFFKTIQSRIGKIGSRLSSFHRNKKVAPYKNEAYTDDEIFHIYGVPVMQLARQEKFVEKSANWM